MSTDGGTQDDDAVLQEAGVEIEGPLASLGLLQHGGDEVTVGHDASFLSRLAED